MSKISSTYLKSLEGEPHVKSLRNRNPPNTFLGRSVVIRVVWRLNLTGIFVNVSPTGSFRKRARRKGGSLVRPLLRKYTTRWLHLPTFSFPFNQDCASRKA